MSRMAPQTPQEPPKGGRFDSPSLWNPSPTDQRRGPAGPLSLEPSPGCPIIGKKAARLHFVAAGRHSEPLGRYEVRPRGLLLTLGWPRVGFQRVGAAAPALWSFKGESEGGNRNPPSGFLRGFGGILCLQRMPPKVLTFAKVKILLLILPPHELNVLDDQFPLLPAEGAKALQHCPL